MKVAIYARVSTEHEAQISALENQVQYYDEILKRYPEWELVERYIDEGITGTSTNKRDSFLRMMKDAKNGKFELIITREVSRFARNIVDTLTETRTLKSYGVQVWFVEDNIWTLNDEDGELRLSIMATLAQNESKKISQRVKAGQQISFKNGVFYGSGNVLGYNRVDKQMVVNKEQADTVRRIFELYSDGKGVRQIQFILEQEGRKTATGMTRWNASVINKVLDNSFYCGLIEYRKQFVPDYLTQKKINNHGEVDKIVVKGSHEPIITEELFRKCKDIKASKSQVKSDKSVGKRNADNVWVRKLRCSCGHTMNRRISYRAKNGNETYMFQCYDQLRTGSPKTRLNKGLDPTGCCDNSTFTQWKLEVLGQFVFGNVLANKQEVFDRAMLMLKDVKVANCDSEDYGAMIEKEQAEIKKLQEKIAILIDMVTEGDISREMFRAKKNTLEDKIGAHNKRIKEFESSEETSKNKNTTEDPMGVLTEFLKMRNFDRDTKIPEEVIEDYVDHIVYDHGEFHWYIRPKYGNEATVLRLEEPTGRKKNNYDDPNHVGSEVQHRLQLAINVLKKPLFIGTFECPRSFFEAEFPKFYGANGTKLPKKEIVVLYLL